jgi:hypothetical protein
MECKNCEVQLSQPDNYCKSCGAKVIRNRLTIRNLWEDFAEQFLNYDNRFLKTYFGIFRRPEEVIGSYVSGTRKKYVNVLSYFALAITLSGAQLFLFQKFFPEVIDLAALVPENTPKESLDISWVYDYFSIIALVNLPFYGLVARVTFIGLKKFNYTEHLTIMTYLVAQFSMTNVFVITPIVLITGVNFYLIGNISNLILMIFTAYTYKRLYPFSTKGIILRSMWFLLILLVLLIAFAILQFVIMVISAGGFEALIEEQKRLQEISYIVSSAINWTS